MSYALQPHDVLKYLNELGYQNISSAQLKEFMKGKNTYEILT